MRSFSPELMMCSWIRRSRSTRIPHKILSKIYLPQELPLFTINMKWKKAEPQSASVDQPEKKSLLFYDGSCSALSLLLLLFRYFILCRSLHFIPIFIYFYVFLPNETAHSCHGMLTMASNNKCLSRSLSYIVLVLACACAVRYVCMCCETLNWTKR